MPSEEHISAEPMEALKFHLTFISNRLINGNIDGSNKFSRGVRGDIEHIMGWEPHPPSLFDDVQKRQVLKVFLNRAQTGLEKLNEDQKNNERGIQYLNLLIQWLNDRILEVGFHVFDEIMAKNISIPESRGDEAHRFLSELKSFTEESSKLGVIVDGNETHPQAFDKGKIMTPQEAARHEELTQLIRVKKLQIADLAEKPLKLFWKKN